MKRNIITIEEDKCTGCGLCADACHEGAIQMIDGKARLISESYCDGLGACLPACPADAIHIEEREAAAFDEKAVEKHLSDKKKAAVPAPAKAPEAVHAVHDTLACGCPGTHARSLERKPAQPAASQSAPTEAQSELRQWPCQIQLV